MSSSIYWPGTKIVKSHGNAFTATFGRVMETRQERAKITARAKTAHCDGFGGNELQGLSRKARESQILKRQRNHAVIEPKGGDIKRKAIKRQAIRKAAI